MKEITLVDYHGTVYEQTGRWKTIELAKRKLRDVEFDTVVFRGVSGAVIAPILAHEMRKKLVAVRKDDGTHSQYKEAEGCFGGSYLIVDDFCSSGVTVKAIVEAIRCVHNFHDLGTPKFVGFYSYKHDEFTLTENHRVLASYLHKGEIHGSQTEASAGPSIPEPEVRPEAKQVGKCESEGTPVSKLTTLFLLSSLRRYACEG